VKVQTLLRRQFLHGIGNDHVGGAVPVGVGVITGVIARTFGFVFMPFLRHGNAGNHHMVDGIVLHGREQFRHARGFLEKST
jgi:hypothetical protein